MNKYLLGASMAAMLASSAALAQTATPATASDPQTQPADAPGATQTAPGDVIVTANPFGVDTPTIVAKVNRRAILDTGGTSIADALAGVPGISSTGFAPGASRPIIRGQDAARVRVLEDGSSSADVSDIGPDHGIPIDPLSAQSIEVVRGAATLRYGSQAIGGVVNILNNRVPTELPTKALTGELSGAFDSVSNTGEGTAMIDGRAGNIAAHADGFYRKAGNYDTPLGEQANSFFQGHGENLGATYFFGGDKDSRIGAAIEQYDAQYGIPSDTTHIDMRQTKVLTRSSFALGSGLLKSINVDGTYADYTHDEVEPDGTIDTTFKNKEADGRAELLFNAIGAIQNSALGVQVRHREFSAVGQDATYLFPTTTDTQAGYLFTDTPIGPLDFQVAGRVEHVRVKGTPASDIGTVRNFTPLSGSIGALYGIGKAVKLGLTFSSTGRAPLITELFARGGHDGPNTFETGDPNLRIERANSLEATLRVNTDRFRFEGSLYSSWFNNYIYGQLTGRLCNDDGDCTGADPDSDLKELFYRQQGAWFRGAEAEAHFSLFKTGTTNLEVRALADYTRATLDDGNNVPRIPPYRAGGGVHYASSKFDLGTLFIHAGPQNEYGLFDTRTPAYNQLTAEAAVRPFAAYPGVELAVIGQNLTDDIQRNAAALNKDQVILPGRNIRVVLRLATL
jgi:iron complex outermembrane receptor protein